MLVCPQLRAVPTARNPHLKTVVSLTHLRGLAKHTVTQRKNLLQHMSKSEEIEALPPFTIVCIRHHTIAMPPLMCSVWPVM
jgi:hypothetical protein